MAKYNIHATKQDWERLYSQVAKFPKLDLAKFKKSSNFDGASYAFIAFVAREEGISRAEVSAKYPLSVYDGVIRAVAN